MYNIIPLSLIVISLAVVLVIVVRKFSVLANLDVDSIPAEKEAKFKEQIYSDRLKRNLFRYTSRLINLARPLAYKAADWVRGLYEKLLDYKEKQKRQEKVEKIQGADDGADGSLLDEAEALFKEEKLNEAEKMLIDHIGLNPRSIDAFKLLALVYRERKEFNEARQTYEHIIKLLEKKQARGELAEDGEKSVNGQAAQVYYNLALLAGEEENDGELVKNVDKALYIEPNNPRFLSLKLELGLKNKDKATALDAYERLSEANPDNRKLDDFKKEIDEL